MRKVDTCVDILPSSPEGRQHHQREDTPITIAADLASECEAIHVRHLHIEDRGVEGIPATDPLEGLRRGPRIARHHPPRGRLPLDHLAVGGVVVDDKETLAPELDVLPGRVKEFETQLYRFLETERPEILQQLGETKALAGDLREALDKAIDDFRQSFLA